MRRITATLAILATFAALAAEPSFATQAKAGKVRTVVDQYEAPAVGAYLGNPWLGYFFLPNCERRIGCVRLMIEPGDRFMTVELDDVVSDTPSYWVLLLNQGVIHEYCGEPSDVLPVSGETEIWVVLPQGVCASGQPGVATRGTVTFNLSKTRQGLRTSDPTDG